MIKIKLLFMAFFLSIFSACVTDPPESLFENPKIMKLYFSGFSSISFAWQENKFYANSPLNEYLVIDNNLKTVKDSFIGMWAFPERGQGIRPKYITNGKDSNHLLFTSCFDAPRWGGLGELNIKTMDREMYLDSTYVISSAVYMPGNVRYIYFYSFGSNGLGNFKAGYYLYDKETKKNKLIFEHQSDIGTSRLSGEFIIGFDIHPNGNKLLYPVSLKGDYPLAVEYDLLSGTHDTLPLTFNPRREQQCLWLRYNKDGNQILYSAYPEYPQDPEGHFNETNEVGVFNKLSRKKIILPVSTNTKLASVNIFPVWSSNNKHILYGSGLAAYNGIGIYLPYIFQNVDEYLVTH